MNIPILRLPLPAGGSAVLLVSSIVGAVTNDKNENWSDVYTHSGFLDAVTVDMTLDVFFAAWLMMLQEEEFLDAYTETTGSEVH
jgi:hypothetical protein